MPKRKSKPPDPFETAKAYAHFELRWKTCTHRECGKRKRCTGGPRGTNRRTGGIPFCKLPGNCKPRKREIPLEIREPPKHKPVPW